MSRSCISILVMLTLLTGTLVGQEHIVHGVTPDIYLQHKVAPKETWYAISRTYNLPPREIAAFNGLTIDKPLDIGQVVKVPLRAANFSQNDVKLPGEAYIPVYHIVGEREWMYRISVNHNKVPIEKLEQWNGISRDQAKAGTKLIVGFLKVKNENAGSAATASSPAARPAAAAPSATATSASVKTTAEQKTVVASERTADPPAVAVSSRQAQTAGPGGYFRSAYEAGGKSASGVAGVFRSTSGWNDGKYYALMSNVTVGTIIRVTYPQTGKSVYAKVLGELPDMRESAGLKLRISDAAASELGATSNKFSVDISY